MKLYKSKVCKGFVQLTDPYKEAFQGSLKDRLLSFAIHGAVLKHDLKRFLLWLHDHTHNPWPGVSFVPFLTAFEREDRRGGLNDITKENVECIHTSSRQVFLDNFVKALKGGWLGG